jgi:TetR/AcrR family transcriptional regulator, cholesterol catabolism regulator
VSSPPPTNAPSKGDRTRRRLLDAAAAEIARRGPDGTSLAAVARRAELKAGSVYFHFDSRDHLIEAVLEEGVRESLRILDDAVSALASPSGAPDRLRAALRAHLRALEELSDYASVVLAPSFHTAGEQMPAYRDALRTYLARWTEIISDAQAAGVLPPGTDPRSLRDLLLGGLNASGLAGRPVADTVRAMDSLLGLAD